MKRKLLTLCLTMLMIFGITGMSAFAAETIEPMDSYFVAPMDAFVDLPDLLSPLRPGETAIFAEGDSELTITKGEPYYVIKDGVYVLRTPFAVDRIERMGVVRGDRPIHVFDARLIASGYTIGRNVIVRSHSFTVHRIMPGFTDVSIVSTMVANNGTPNPAVQANVIFRSGVSFVRAVYMVSVLPRSGPTILNLPVQQSIMP